MLGKETLVNATIGKMRSQAKKDSPALRKKMELMFGKEAESVLNDLKEGKKSENVLFLAFNELAEMQPISLSEVPETYLRAGNGRIFYMLKTWNIKLLDTFRREALQTMQTNPVRGLKNLVWLTALVVLMD